MNFACAINIVGLRERGETDMFDEEKFNAIVAKHSRALWLYCFDKLKNKELADETLNDIFTVLWKKWDRIDTEDNVRAYLYRVTDFCVKHNHAKNVKYYEKHESYEALETDPEGLSRSDEYFSDKPGEDENNLLLIKKALDSEYQELFDYRYIQKKTIQEIVSIMSIPYSTLRYRLHKMEGMIREIIKKTF